MGAQKLDQIAEGVPEGEPFEVQQQELVQATGPLQEFDLERVENEIGYELEANLFGDWEGDQPEEFYGQTVTVNGAVAQVVGPKRVRARPAEHRLRGDGRDRPNLPRRGRPGLGPPADSRACKRRVRTRGGAADARRTAPGGPRRRGYGRRPGRLPGPGRRGRTGRLLSGGGAGTAGGPLESTTGQQAQGPPSPPPDSVSVGADGVPPWVTPNKNFYLIDTAASSPQIDRDSWKLSIKGAVDNPIEIGYDELVSTPNREAYITMACVSNEVGGGLVSNALWTGVPLRAVLEEAGVSQDKIRKASEQLVGRSVDGWTSGFRTELAFDGREALVAFGMNGSELPQKHGYPVRLAVPGLYGYVSTTKWLQEIEITDWGFDAYWIKRNWSKTGPIKTQSRIDTPKGGQKLSAGRVPIAGVAWAPTRGISRVEVSTDGGESWNDARLARQLDEDAWRQWAYEWDAGSISGKRTIKVRATDGEGNTQTSEEAKPIPSGATGYHTIDVTVTS